MAKNPKKATKSIKKTAPSKTAPVTSKKRGAKATELSTKKTETSTKKERKLVSKKNGHSPKKLGSASAPPKKLGAKKRGLTVGRSVGYYDQIHVYLNGIRPGTATLGQIYQIVVPTATSEDDQFKVREALRNLKLEGEVEEVATEIYRAK